MLPPPPPHACACAKTGKYRQQVPSKHWHISIRLEGFISQMIGAKSIH